jgi:hypothetical protein
MPRLTHLNAKGKVTMNANGALRQVQYEGVDYSLFDDVKCFCQEIEKSKKGILKTNFTELPKHIQEIFGFVTKIFGPNANETKAVLGKNLYCGACGASFTDAMLVRLIAPYRHGVEVTKECPKCHSTELLYLYRL